MESVFEGLPTWMNALLFLLGMVIITKGADWFTGASVVIAERTHVPKGVIGATIVSVATTFPEFSVSLTATFFHQPQTAIGNAVGSTICNIGLILATVVLFRPVPIHQETVRKQGLFMIIGGGAVIALSIQGVLTRIGGLILVVGLITYICYSIKTARSHRKNQQALKHVKIDSKGLGREIVLFLLGAVCVGIGSMLLVRNAKILAVWLGIPELIIGLTMVAIGTSLPEYVTAITATIKGHSELGVGNVIGANILNIFWVLGVCGLIHPLHIEHQTRVLDFPFMFSIMVLLVIMVSTDSKLKRWEGGLLFGVYLGYLTLMFTLFA
jgi:cation:H+ antiporter